MKKLPLFFIPSLLLLNSSVLAFNLFNGQRSILLGVFSANQGKETRIDMPDFLFNTYTITKKESVGGLLGLGYFLPFPDHSNSFNLAYGINAFYLTHTKVKGDVVWNGFYNALSYQYKINHVPLYATIKTAAGDDHNRYTVTLDAGIGPNFMTTGSYKETSLDGYNLPTNNFSGRSSTAFSATAGIGIRLKNLVGSLPIELGYRFFYLGQGNFNNRTNQLNTLTTGQSYANALILSVTV